MRRCYLEGCSGIHLGHFESAHLVYFRPVIPDYFEEHYRCHSGLRLGDCSGIHLGHSGSVHLVQIRLGDFVSHSEMRRCYLEGYSEIHLGDFESYFGIHLGSLEIRPAPLVQIHLGDLESHFGIHLGPLEIRLVFRLGLLPGVEQE